MGFRLVRVDVADIVGVVYFSVDRSIFFFNEKYGACVGDAF